MFNSFKERIAIINLMGFSGFHLPKIFTLCNDWSKEDFDLIKSLMNNDFDFMRDATRENYV